MGMGFAPTWLRQVSPLLHTTTLTTALTCIDHQQHAVDCMNFPFSYYAQVHCYIQVTWRVQLFPIWPCSRSPLPVDIVQM